MIVAVSGGKGGVGKTTLTLNLGHELDAVLVDADMTTPDLPRTRGPDLHDVLSGKAEPLDAVDIVNTVKVVSCRRTIAGARASDLSQLGDVARRLDRRFKHVLIDCPAGLARDVGHQLACADAAVLVTTPKRPALWSALRTMKVTKKVDTPIAAVVVNRIDSESDSKIADRVEHQFGTPTFEVPRTEEIQASQTSGKPLELSHPDSEALESLEDIASALHQCESQLSDKARPY